MDWRIWLLIACYIILIGLFIWREIIITRLAKQNTYLKSRLRVLKDQLADAKAQNEDLHSKYMTLLERTGKNDGK